MYHLEELQQKHFTQVWEIMQDSFPLDERRDKMGQEEVFNNPQYHMYGYLVEDRVAAFISVWELSGFSFVEHFAVEKNSRNLGLGGRILEELLQKINHRAILEVEPPEQELARRRIAFYERNGFVFNDYDYIQPALSAEGKAIPLKIMSSGHELSEEEFVQIKNVLYREVYHVMT